MQTIDEDSASDSEQETNNLGELTDSADEDEDEAEPKPKRRFQDIYHVRKLHYLKNLFWVNE